MKNKNVLIKCWFDIHKNHKNELLSTLIFQIVFEQVKLISWSPTVDNCPLHLQLKQPCKLS